MIKVVSLGGSIVAPDGIDVEFVRRFRDMIVEQVGPADQAAKNQAAKNSPGAGGTNGTAASRPKRSKDTAAPDAADNRIVLVVGGGGPARRYQQAYRDLTATAEDSALDWIGIGATRLNGRFLKAVFGPYCREDIVTNPSVATTFTGQVLIATGWKPSFSTDFDAVVLAERFGADTVVNLSNIAKVYTADPKQDPDAKPIDTLSWSEFRRIVGDSWVPGGNAPFDPIAAQKAEGLKLRVIVADGHDIQNVRNILSDREYVGTTIGPD